MEMQISVIFAEKKWKINTWKIKNIVKLGIIAIIQENIVILCIAYATYNSVPKRISIVFHNGSTYDYHFIKKQLAEEITNNLLV